MRRTYTNKPVVPYMMNSHYCQMVDGYPRMRGYMNGVNYLNRGYPYGSAYGCRNLPLNRETWQDADKAFEMYGRRTKRYNKYLKRWETQVSDLRTVTVERDANTNREKKYVHTPYVMSERYLTKFEFSFIKWRIIGIASLIIALIIVGFFVLSQYDVI